MDFNKPSVFIDTNVWLYYFLGDKSHCNGIVRLLDELKRRDAFVATNALAAKDVFYLIPQALKRQAASEGLAVSGTALNETAWACIKQMSKLAYIANIGAGDFMEAQLFRSKHPDFEDNLMAATAAPYDFFITYDETLARHLGRQAMPAEELLELLAEA